MAGTIPLRCGVVAVQGAQVDVYEGQAGAQVLRHRAVRVTKRLLEHIYHPLVVQLIAGLRNSDGGWRGGGSER